MTKQAVFWLLIATFAVTSFVNTSHAEESYDRPLDLSERTIRRAVRDTLFEQKYGQHQSLSGPFRRRARVARVARLRVFTVDTTDQAACASFKQLLEEMNPATYADKATKLCDENNGDRIKSVIVIDEIECESFRQALSKNMLQASEKSLLSDTRELAIEREQATGLLWTPIQGVTKWDKTKTVEAQTPFDRKPYQKGSADSLNQTVQPIAGVATYTMARQNGKSPLESFGQSVATSTFFWEYGVDAAVQQPKVQDLLVNPVVEAVLGEYFFSLEQNIKNNQGEVMGSKAVGSVAMVMLNPAASLARMVNRAAGKRVIESSNAEMVLRRYQSDFGRQSSVVGLQLNFRLAPGN